MRRGRHTAIAIASAALLLALSTAGGQLDGGVAVAQTVATLRLVAQTLWRQGDVPIALTLDVEAPASATNLELAATVYGRVGGRIEFTQTLSGRPRESVVTVNQLPLDQVAVDASGHRTMSIPATLGREGVYPIRVELREQNAGDVLAAFVTHVVQLPATIDGDALEVATVVPLHAAPGRRPDGSVLLGAASIEEFAALALALDRHPEAGLTLAPTAETLDSLNDSDDGRAVVTAVADAIGSRQVLGGPYVPTSVGAVADARLEGEDAASRSRAQAVIEGTLGVAVTSTTALVDEALTEDGVDRLAELGNKQVVIPETLLVPVDQPTTLTQPFALRGGQATGVIAAAADTGLASHFEASDDAVLSAHHLLSDLAVVWFDRPGRLADRRGVVAAPPRATAVSAAMIDAFLTGLAASPVLTGVTLDRLLVDVAPATVRGSTLIRRFAANTPSPASLPSAAIRTERNRLSAFAGIAGEDNPVVDRVGATLAVSLGQDLLRRQRAGYVSGAGRQIDTQLRGIDMPTRRSITLTSRDGDIPITVTSTLPYDVRLVMRLSSDTVAFPEGAIRTLDLVRRNTTETFAVNARSSGSLPLAIRLESPNGALVVAESRFVIRSAAAPRVGIALSAVSALFLLVWWARHWRDQRSKRLR